MHYKEYGNPGGQLVVFIHGGFTTNESFEQQYHLLPDKRMIFVDLPGCGKSERVGDKAFSFEDSAMEVIKLIEHLGSTEINTGGTEKRIFINLSYRDSL